MIIVVELVEDAVQILHVKTVNVLQIIVHPIVQVKNVEMMDAVVPVVLVQPEVLVKTDCVLLVTQIVQVRNVEMMDAVVLVVLVQLGKNVRMVYVLVHVFLIVKE
jgi:hypothetical protein